MLKALRMAEEAYEEAKELEDHFLKARTLQALASIHYNLSQYKEATRFYLESIRETAQTDRHRTKLHLAGGQSLQRQKFQLFYQRIPHQGSGLSVGDARQNEISHRRNRRSTTTKN